MTTNTEQVRRQFGMIACFGILLLLGTAAIVVGTITTYGFSHQEKETVVLSHVLIADNKPCPRYYSIRNQIWNSSEVQCIMNKHSELLKYLSVHSGIPKVGIHDATDYIYDPLFVQELHGVEVPPWAKSLDSDVLDSLTILEYMIMPAFTIELKRLQTGNLLSEIVTHMLSKRDGDLTPDRKMFMYSGHDSTVGPLMHSLGVFEAFQVPYVGTLAIDLVVDLQQSHFVKIFYKNSTDHEPFLLTIPGCEPSCPLEEFVQLTKHLIPVDWREECDDTDVSNTILDYSIPTRGNMEAWIDCFKKTVMGK